MRQRAPLPDPRDLPVYTIPDAAHYLRVPPSTLKTWVHGRRYRTNSGEKAAKPLIVLPGSSYPPLLSFFNVVEAHLLAAIRRSHGVPMAKVRRALERVKRELDSPHPLIDARFQTDGIDLFVEHYGRLVDQDGQAAIRGAIEAYLKRVEWDTGSPTTEPVTGRILGPPRANDVTRSVRVRRGALASKRAHDYPVRLYPFVYTEMDPDEPKVVVIDPRRAFGKPVLTGTGIQTAVIASRHRAGESIEELASDYGVPSDQIENAIRCEIRAAA
jgi:uncharacterized protein (DUF433 family)